MLLGCRQERAGRSCSREHETHIKARMTIDQEAHKLIRLKGLKKPLVDGRNENQPKTETLLTHGHADMVTTLWNVGLDDTCARRAKNRMSSQGATNAPNCITSRERVQQLIKSYKLRICAKRKLFFISLYRKLGFLSARRNTV